MHWNEDNRRLLLGILATTVIHLALFVFLGFVDFSQATPVSPIRIELTDTTESLIELPEPEPEPEDEEILPEEPQLEPDDPVQDVPIEPDVAEPDDAPPTVEQAPVEAEPQVATEAAPAQTPAPAAPRERAPDPDAFVQELGTQPEVDREALRQTRPSTPSGPVPDVDGTFATEEAARRQAAIEFVNRLDEQQRAIAEELARDEGDDTTDQDADDAEIVFIRSRLTDITASRERAEDESQNGLPGPETDDPSGDVGSGDDIEWADGRDRSRIAGNPISFSSGDIRFGFREALLEVSFQVDSRGIVAPGSVGIDAGAAVLTAEARLRLQQTIQSWRFTANPGAPLVRGVIRLELRRSS